MKFSEKSAEFQKSLLRSESRVYGWKFVNLVHASFGFDIDKSMDFLISLGQYLYTISRICSSRRDNSDR